jgi:hypothetical protein
VADPTPVGVDESLDPVQWLEVSSAPDLLGTLWGLYYSIYYGGAEPLKALPDSVLKAYTRVQGAFGG